MDEPQLRQHLTILGWLHIAASGFAILIGGFVFIVLEATHSPIRFFRSFG